MTEMNVIFVSCHVQNGGDENIIEKCGCQESFRGCMRARSREGRTSVEHHDRSPKIDRVLAQVEFAVRLVPLKPGSAFAPPVVSPHALSRIPLLGVLPRRIMAAESGGEFV